MKDAAGGTSRGTSTPLHANPARIGDPGGCGPLLFLLRLATLCHHDSGQCRLCDPSYSNSGFALKAEEVSPESLIGLRESLVAKSCYWIQPAGAGGRQKAGQHSDG